MPDTGYPNGQGGARRKINTILLSAPVHLPFAGDFELLYIQADQARAMDLRENLAEIAGELADRLSDARAGVFSKREAFAARWGAFEEWMDLRARAREEFADQDEYDRREADYQENRDAHQKDLDEYVSSIRRLAEIARDLNRQINLRIIAHAVTKIGALRKEKNDQGDWITVWHWPFEGEPPNPQDPASWEGWPDAVLNWMAGDALLEVRGQLQNPNSGGR